MHAVENAETAVITNIRIFPPSADCDAPSAPDNGYVNVSDSRQVGDIAVYSCIGGYDLEGNATRECLSNNTWSGSQPYCKNVGKYSCVLGVRRKNDRLRVTLTKQFIYLNPDVDTKWKSQS